MAPDQELLDPRIARTRSVVIAAAIELAGECGFGRTTIEAIAEKSGVARSTIYRHWDSLPELLHDAMHETVPSQPTIDTGSLRGDLLAIYQGLAAFTSSPTFGHIMVAMFAEARRDEKAAALLHRFSKERRQRVLDSIDAAKTRGELPESADGMQMTIDLAAPIFFRAIVLLETIDPDFIEAHVDRWLDHYGYEG